MPPESNVLSFEDHPVVTARDVNEGFSDRLNTLIDLTSMSALERKSRAQWLSEVMNCNRSSTSKWLSKDLPPKDANSEADSDAPNLHKLVSFLLNLTTEFTDTNPVRVISWLRYGNASGDNPLSCQKSTMESSSDENGPVPIEMTILAAHLVSQLASDDTAMLNINIMEKVIGYLKVKKIVDMKQIDESDRYSIRAFIEILSTQ